MEHTPPPFFKTGPTPLARLLIFSALSLALLVADTRFNYLTPLRQIAAVIVYPLQRIASAPASIARRIGDFFVTHSSLRAENARLTQERLSNAPALQQLKALQAENRQLRELLAARERVNADARLAEVLYAARDPFSRKIVIDKGLQDNVKAGQAVVDTRGVVGQVTRAYPWLAEVTLITDQHHEYSYVLHPRQDAADLHASRVKFGRGVKGRYWQWKLANRNGADFDIDMLTLDVSPSVRRV